MTAMAMQLSQSPQHCATDETYRLRMSQYATVVMKYNQAYQRHLDSPMLSKLNFQLRHWNEKTFGSWYKDCTRRTEQKRLVANGKDFVIPQCSTANLPKAASLPRQSKSPPVCALQFHNPVDKEGEAKILTRKRRTVAVSHQIPKFLK
jgi:hypothetical protein